MKFMISKIMVNYFCINSFLETDDGIIESKEETCRNARYEQTTLENFRYMLDSKIQSLEEKKQDMIKKIKSRETDLKNMFNELIKESEEN